MALPLLNCFSVIFALNFSISSALPLPGMFVRACLAIGVRSGGTRSAARGNLSISDSSLPSRISIGLFDSNVHPMCFKFVDSFASPLLCTKSFRFEVLAGGVGVGVFVVAESDGDAVGGAWGGLLGQFASEVLTHLADAGR